MSYIAIERNRRKLMNQHLKVLRSLTPCFYVKRGDQASIIGGVIEFIKELHLILQSLESKKRRKSLSPSPSIPSPTTPSPRPPLLLLSSTPPPPPSSHTHNHDYTNPIHGVFENNNNNIGKELGMASCNSSVADVEAKISGSNVILRTISRRIPGQIVKLIEILEKHSFEILNLNISSMEDTVLYSFVIKIGLDCQLSVEDLTVQVQQSFSASKDMHYIQVNANDRLL